MTHHSGVPAWLLELSQVDRRTRDSPKSQTCECHKAMTKKSPTHLSKTIRPSIAPTMQPY